MTGARVFSQLAGMMFRRGLVHTLTFAPDEAPVQHVLSRIVTSLPVADVSLQEPGIGSVVRQLQLGERSA